MYTTDAALRISASGEDDHLSLVTGLTRFHARELEAQGITTLEQLGQLALPLPFRPDRGSKEALERVCHQARVQLEGRRTGNPVRELLQPVEEGRGLAKLPTPSPGDVFLDLESMATSRPEDAPRGMEFLYDLNRLNVATSRARCACILVASPRLLEPECKTSRQMRLANAMCRYVELASGRAAERAESPTPPRPPGRP